MFLWQATILHARISNPLEWTQGEVAAEDPPVSICVCSAATWQSRFTEAKTLGKCVRSGGYVDEDAFDSRWYFPPVLQKRGMTPKNEKKCHPKQAKPPGFFICPGMVGAAQAQAFRSAEESWYGRDRNNLPLYCCTQPWPTFVGVPPMAEVTVDLAGSSYWSFG